MQDMSSLLSFLIASAVSFFAADLGSLVLRASSIASSFCITCMNKLTSYRRKIEEDEMNKNLGHFEFVTNLVSECKKNLPQSITCKDQEFSVAACIYRFYIRIRPQV